MTYEIAIVDLEHQATVVGRATVELALLSAKLAEILPAVATYLGSAGVPPIGPPFTKYGPMTDSEIDIEAGMPVATALAGEKDVTGSSLPGGKAAKTIHVGPYDQLGLAHEALAEWVKNEGHEMTCDVWEVYITDPSQVPDPKDWQTIVYMGIK